MSVFISWSGERSRAVAIALRDWLPDVLQSVNAWMSEHDIDAGARWHQRLTQVLETSRFGIICLTPENQKAAWVLFEAGALSKSIQEARVIPVLIGMTAPDIEPPLSQFQAVGTDRMGMLKLLESINATSEVPLPGDRLKRHFERWWPELEVRIQAAKQLSAPTNIARRSEYELLAEVLDIVRSLNKPSLSPISGLKGRRMEGQSEVIIDSRVLMGSNGRLTRIGVSPNETVQSFLDAVYFEISPEVRAFTYGESWVLQNVRTNEIYDRIGIEYCRSKGKVRDDAPFSKIGIVPGDRLVVLPIHSKASEILEAE
ncbi:MAG TPA: toll/interleukin-1 receptor domain-containing protein [Bryobacteraceae bacterium]|nr:toll/interleukin-1 receptor domain-containing protein [Bryobacteraceae bacterium]